MLIEIKHILTNEIIVSGDYENIIEACQKNKDKLAFADLERAHLERANLEHANLEHAHLERAHLEFAHLEHVNLERAHLEHANLNWQSHQLLSQILLNNSGDNLQKIQFAGLVRISFQLNWCWDDFKKLELPQKIKQWAIEVFKKYPNYPDILNEIEMNN